MRAWILKNIEYVNWDRWGMALSFVCALHCVLTPLVMLSIPFFARYYLAHPLFHLFFALAIVPVGVVAFVSGFRHHRRLTPMALGFPGLGLVAFIPYLVHDLHFNIHEPALMVIGSSLLIAGHWSNRRSCMTCQRHSTRRHAH